MQGIDYSKPGAQAFINSWADEFASWGVDYVKLDGVGSFDIPDVQAWSQALAQTGRPIHLELSNSLNIADASTWAQYSNGWRTGGDIECYGCEASGTSYPLTDWASVESRFNQVAQWQPYGGPGAFNDYDSLELGNGSNDGLTPDERQTQMSLWSLAASPLILGTDLTHLDPLDLSYLKNRAVISVDQDAIDASRIVNTATEQVFAKTETSGDVVVGLFNVSGSPEVVSTTASAIGLPAASAYRLDNLWTHRVTESGSTIAADVPAHGVALFRIRPTRRPRPGAARDHGRADRARHADRRPGRHHHRDLHRQRRPAGPRRPADAARAVRLDGHRLLARLVRLGGRGADRAGHVRRDRAPADLAVPAGHAHRHRRLPLVRTAAAAGVAEPAGHGQPAGAGARTGPTPRRPTRRRRSRSPGSSSGSPAPAPTCGPTPTPTAPSTSPARPATTATIETEVTSQQNMTGFGKAGIIVRNDMTGSGTSPEGVVLFESPVGRHPAGVGLQRRRQHQLGHPGQWHGPREPAGLPGAGQEW